jgi:anhydro-N-acetylmuramic acid kinase
MVYTAIGLMSGSSLDGLDICYAEFTEVGGEWSYKILATDCVAYDKEWAEKLRTATTLTAHNYTLLHAAYGQWIGKAVNNFIATNSLQYKVALIGSHGHTTFHDPQLGSTGQIGCGATIAALTQLPVVSDLRVMDIAFGGQGAPIVPIGEKYLLGNYNFYLNLGGIANISYKHPTQYIAFDICAANRILNMLIEPTGKAYDENGNLSATGKLNEPLLQELNAMDYYALPYPKSLANSFGVQLVYPVIDKYNIPLEDKLYTYTHHIAVQIANSIKQIPVETTEQLNLLATGGGAFNGFLMEQIKQALIPLNVEVHTANAELNAYKEALIMGFMAVLRWREQYNSVHTATGASRSSVGGALWLGGEE